MKKSLILAGSALLLSVTLHDELRAQGTVSAANIGGGVSAPVSACETGSPLGAGSFAEIWAGTSANSLERVGERIPFLANGFFSGGAVSVAGIPSGSTAFIQVKAWSGEAATFSEAVAGSEATGESNVVSITLGGLGFPPTTPAGLFGLKGFEVCGGGTQPTPEPEPEPVVVPPTTTPDPVVVPPVPTLPPVPGQPSTPMVPVPSTDGLFLWIDDSFPLSANQRASVSGSGSWGFSSSPFGGVALSGDSSLVANTPNGRNQTHFTRASTPLELGADDKLVAHVFVDPSNPPSMVLFQWYDGSWNHRARWGRDQFPFGPSVQVSSVIPESGKWLRLEVDPATVGLGNRPITGMAFTVFGGRVAFDAVGRTTAPAPPAPEPAPSPAPGTVVDTVWIDDELPQPIQRVGLSGGDTWNDWITSNPTPVSGSRAHASSLSSGLHQHFFQVPASRGWEIGSRDKLFANIYLDPATMPEMVMLQWLDGSGWHRARWGSNRFPFGPSVRIGALPAAGEWVRLEVPAEDVGLAGSKVTGMAFTLFGGKAVWDASGNAGPGVPPPTQSVTEIWLDDALPSNTVRRRTSGNDSWDDWITENPRPFLGSASHLSRRDDGLHQHYFTVPPSNAWPVAAGDRLFSYVYIRPGTLPSMVMLQFFDGSGWVRARWGSNRFTFGPSIRIGSVPATGEWVRLEVSAEALGLVGRRVEGVAFTLFGGEAAWDALGRVSGGASGAGTASVNMSGAFLDGSTVANQIPSESESLIRLLIPVRQERIGSQSNVVLVERSSDLRNWELFEVQDSNENQIAELTVSASVGADQQFYRARQVESNGDLLIEER